MLLCGERRFSLAAIASASLIAGSGLTVPAAAQPSFGPNNTVTWTAALQDPRPVKPGAKLKVALKGAVLDTWHVYGLTQLPEGPTPLKVSVAAADIAAADGAPVGTEPVKRHDPSFDLETQSYERDFTVTVPVKLNARLAAGAQAIPLDVRFQTCNGRICQPPKTVRLSVPVTVQGKG